MIQFVPKAGLRIAAFWHHSFPFYFILNNIKTEKIASGILFSSSPQLFN